MKKQFLLINTIFIHFFNSTIAQIAVQDSVRYEVLYDYTYQLNKEDKAGIKTEQMMLMIGKEQSFYASVNNLKMMMLLANEPVGGVMPKIPKTKILSTFTKNFVNKTLTIKDMIGQDHFAASCAMPTLRWKLEDEAKEISGNVCKKATTTFAGRSYIAWYSTQIAIADGPYKFGGLPGLIFLVHDTDNFFRFELAGLKTTTKSFFPNDEALNYKPISCNDFDSLVKQYREKPSLFVNNGGMTFPQELLDMADKRAKERLLYENNPLEISN